MAFEKVVAGGSVIDGTGAAAYRADVAIADGRIEAVGDLSAAERGETIDASGQVVCPGFIDMHAHSDVSMLDDPGGESKAYQGVTTEVVGNCGSSAFPAGLLTPAELQEIAPVQVVEGSAVRYAWRDFDGWADALEGSGVSLNVVGQIGHSTLRQAAKATEARPANDLELALMKRLVAEAVEQGAVALTTQLTGPPASAAPAGEIAALAAEAHRFPGAFYATHARLHSGNHFNAVDEAIEIGELTGIPVQYSHIALIDSRHHGEGGEMVRRMEAARERGVDALYDVYPYTAGACGITGVLPLWAQEDGPAAVQRRLADPDTCARMAEEIARGFWGGVPLPWDKYVITKANRDSTRWMVGKVWTEIAARRGESPVEAILSVAREDPWLEGVVHIRSEDDVRYFLGHPLAMIGSDGKAVSPDGVWGSRLSASSRIRLLPTGARPLRARARRAHAGGRRAQDDRRGGRPAADGEPRADRRGQGGRRGRVRRGHRHRQRDLGGPAPVSGRHRPRPGERRVGDPRRRPHPRPPGAGAAPRRRVAKALTCPRSAGPECGVKE